MAKVRGGKMGHNRSAGQHHKVSRSKRVGHKRY